MFLQQTYVCRRQHWGGCGQGGAIWHAPYPPIPTSIFGQAGFLNTSSMLFILTQTSNTSTRRRCYKWLTSPRYWKMEEPIFSCPARRVFLPFLIRSQIASLSHQDGSGNREKQTLQIYQDRFAEIFLLFKMRDSFICQHCTVLCFKIIIVP